MFSNSGIPATTFYDWTDCTMALTNFMSYWSTSCMAEFSDEQNWLMHGTYDDWASNTGKDNGAPAANQVYDTPLLRDRLHSSSWGGYHGIE